MAILVEEDLNERSKLDEYVKTHGGKQTIQRILIANNGLAAVKEIRSVRRWAYSTFGDDRIVKFIVMASTDDLSSNAEFIRLADEFVTVAGGTNNYNYANVQLIVETAQKVKADAVWAGWGHASENPLLPESLKSVGIVFIGPPAGAMRALGDKISSMLVAQTAGVPCIPWSGTEITIETDDDGQFNGISPELYTQACVSSSEEGFTMARRVGYPLMIKASEGGGGKGIRKVEREEDFASNFDFVQREVPGSPIFLMQLAQEARHLEVQLIADEYGQAVALYGRDCSVQRRHQKIIEEAPVTIVPSQAEWEEMERAAVRLAQMVGYVNAGTVEFLFDVRNRRFSFLELNPRLQVEHPCTEGISGVNIPAAQLMIAMGIPLYRNREIRKIFGQDEEAIDFIDFNHCPKNPPNGHIIACRITSENPQSGFKPGGGLLEELTFRSSVDVWAYFSVNSFGNVHPYADSQVGHVFSWGKTRKEAINRMVLALKELTLRAEFRTTTEYLVALLEHSDFQQECHTTAWLDGLISAKFGGNPIIAWDDVVIATIVYHGKNALSLRESEIKEALLKGQAPPASSLERFVKKSFVFNQIQYEAKITQIEPQVFTITVCGSCVTVSVVGLLDGGLLIILPSRKKLLVYAQAEPQGLRITINGTTVNVEDESDPTVVRSPSPGKLVRYLVKEGVVVPANTAIAEIEVMKMYMTLSILDAGSIMPTKVAGSSLTAGDIVARIKLVDPAGALKAAPNCKGFNEEVSTTPTISSLMERFHNLTNRLEAAIFGGFDFPSNQLARFIKDLSEVIFDARLPFDIARNRLSNAVNRLPAGTVKKLGTIFDAGLESPDHKLLEETILILTDLLSDCDARDATLIHGILDAINPHRSGVDEFVEQWLAKLCERFYSESLLFGQAQTIDIIVRRLNDKYGREGIEEASRMFRAWSSGDNRQKLLGSIIKAIFANLTRRNSPPTSRLLEVIRKLTLLNDKSFSRINQAAREALINLHMPSVTELREEVESQLFQLSHMIPGPTRDAEVAKSVFGLAHHMDVLPTFFLHESNSLKMMAVEIYVRRVFEAFDFVQSGSDENTFCWIVKAPPALTEQSRSSPSLSEFHQRAGCFAVFEDLASMRKGFSKVITKLPVQTATKNVVYFAVPHCGNGDDWVISHVETFLISQEKLLLEHDIKRFTLMMIRSDSTNTSIFTYRQILGWREDCQVRNMEPAMSYLLELPRILHFYNIQLLHADATGQVHIYKAVPNGESSSPGRLFIRVLVRPRAIGKGHYSLMTLTEDASAIFADLLDAVSMVQSQTSKPFDCNHLYINILPTFYSDPRIMADLFLTLMGASEEKLLKVRIMEGEIRMNLAPRKDESPDRYRFFMWNETGFVNRIAVYQETRAKEKDPPKLLCLPGMHDELGLDNTAANAPHSMVGKLQIKRNRVHALETSYVYDFPAIFAKALELTWTSKSGLKQLEKAEFTCTELVLTSAGELEETQRPPGQNDIGMVAWRMRIATPQHPTGRDIIVIANDIDFEIGSFGVAEDKLFAAASSLARQRKWPRIFLSANSGARIGLAEELRTTVKAAWTDSAQPDLGFEYLYLEPADYERLKSSVKAEHIPERDHYRITDILTGLGVENLSGSALIASETSRAYTESFTLTFVTGRSVGIGAYLVRLGQRVIQKQSQPIILTGVQALNQLLGREVYASNLQIGGPQIMAANGVAHQVVRTDLEGVQAILRWLDFVPIVNPEVPLTSSLPPYQDDDPNRPIAYIPSGQNPEDPRLLVTGAYTADGIFLGGLLDRDSFVEYQTGWARSVVVGRGRIGGLPVAVLLVETRTTQSLIPADPATPSSELQTIPQAGQVWYPDSAYKTAQFLRDCNHGEGLPLFILANWRGFSGGQRDLFDEILKFGSYIVDGLREYRPPVFVYLPPRSQLRGGSWVVVDTAINPRRIEMYADPSARGGILEAEGLVAIKFRGPHLRELLFRLVPEAKGWNKDKQDRLIPVMHNVACSFADLHDRPGRMYALGIIKGVVPWRDARRHFYHRLRVRLWIMRMWNRAAHLLDIPIMEEDRMATLYDDLLRILDTEWLPAMFIDPTRATDEEISNALDRHHQLLETKLNNWCQSKALDELSELIDVKLGPNEKSLLLAKLLADDRKLSKSASPTR